MLLTALLSVPVPPDMLLPENVGTVALSGMVPSCTKGI